MAATIATWAVIVAAIGHADTARLLAAVTLIRAVQMLTKLATPIVAQAAAEGAKGDPPPSAARWPLRCRPGRWSLPLVLVALLAGAMKAIGQDTGGGVPAVRRARHAGAIPALRRHSRLLRPITGWR